MKLTCGTCGHEIVGAFRISGVDLDHYAFRWISVPDIINAHDAQCSAE